MRSADDAIVFAGPVFARYPNLDNITGAWRFLHAAKERSVPGGKGPLATDALLENTDGVLRPPRQCFLGGSTPATF